jgi:hypothetical protein
MWISCILGWRGAPGGILLMWDRQMVERCIIENFDWAYAGVYGPNDDVE